MHGGFSLHFVVKIVLDQCEVINCDVKCALESCRLCTQREFVVYSLPMKLLESLLVLFIQTYFAPILTQDEMELVIVRPPYQLMILSVTSDASIVVYFLIQVN